MLRPAWLLLRIVERCAGSRREDLVESGSQPVRTWSTIWALPDLNSKCQIAGVYFKAQGRSPRPNFLEGSGKKDNI